LSNGRSTIYSDRITQCASGTIEKLITHSCKVQVRIVYRALDSNIGARSAHRNQCIAPGIIRVNKFRTCIYSSGEINRGGTKNRWRDEQARCHRVRKRLIRCKAIEFSSENWNKRIEYDSEILLSASAYRKHLPKWCWNIGLT